MTDKVDAEVQLMVVKAAGGDIDKAIVRLGRATMEELGLSNGSVVELEGARKTAAIAMADPEMDEGIAAARIDGFTRKNARIGLGEPIKVRKARASYAKRIVLSIVETEVPIKANEQIVAMIKEQLKQRPVFKGDVFPIVSTSRLFGKPIVLAAVETDPTGQAVATNDATVVEITRKKVGMSEAGSDITYEHIGGLTKEVAKLREMIELPMRHPELFDKLGIEPPRGILLYGPPGTGKTMLAKAVANECGANFISVAGPELLSKWYGESEQHVRDIFDEAKEKAPTIIFFDEIDALASKREDQRHHVDNRVVAQLLACMDGLTERGKVVVIAATNRQDALDPALRRTGRLDREMEIGVPDANARLEILNIHTRQMPVKEVDMKEIAGTTHGFVGSDLAGLSKEAAMIALRRILPGVDLNKDIPAEVLDNIKVTQADFEEAMKDVRPSAMREVFVEPPNITWNDVGGMEAVKRELLEIIDWPMKSPETFKEMGIQPPRGILLYGPPGTGKTMLAKAVAAQTEANFISVRGPELLSKWIGQSEKAVREIFRKARLVAPCIIFFDEIDSLVPARGSSRHNLDGVINQILTEMDGMTETKGVVVIGATNRPDAVDMAMLRPGRMDRLVYVAPPNDDREAIFKVHTRNTPLADDVNLKELVGLTKDYVGADIAAICREAVMLSLRDDFRPHPVQMKYFREAIKKVRPTLNEQTLEYFNGVHEKLKGGRPDEVGRNFEVSTHV